MLDLLLEMAVYRVEASMPLSLEPPFPMGSGSQGSQGSRGSLRVPELLAPMVSNQRSSLWLLEALLDRVLLLEWLEYCVSP